MGKRRKQRRQQKGDRKLDIIVVGPPLVGVLKATMLKDLLMTIDLVAAHGAQYGLSPSDSIDDIFTMMTADGYEITRDGDTILIRDPEGPQPVTSNDAEVEINIKRAASQTVSRDVALRRSNAIVMDTPDINEDTLDPRPEVKVINGEPVVADDSIH